MIGTFAIVCALLAIGSGLYRFAPGAVAGQRNVTLVAALAAGALGLVQWGMTQDSRWLVGGIFLLGAAYPGWAAGKRRALTVAAIVLSLLGAALYGIAASRPMVTPGVTATV